MQPGRSIIEDAGALVAEVQYVKLREGRRIVVTDASMTELIRPALYEAYHHIVKVDSTAESAKDAEELRANLVRSTASAGVVGPACEPAGVPGHNRKPPDGPRGA